MHCEKVLRTPLMEVVYTTMGAQGPCDESPVVALRMSSTLRGSRVHTGSSFGCVVVLAAVAAARGRC